MINFTFIFLRLLDVYRMVIILKSVCLGCHHQNRDQSVRNQRTLTLTLTLTSHSQVPRPPRDMILFYFDQTWKWIDYLWHVFVDSMQPKLTRCIAGNCAVFIWHKDPCFESAREQKLNPIPNDPCDTNSIPARPIITVSIRTPSAVPIPSLLSDSGVTRKGQKSAVARRWAANK